MQRHRSGIISSALVRRGLRQPTHGLHGRPCETAQHRRPRWVADLRNPKARDHLWHPAARSVYTNAPSAVVHLIMLLRSSHLVGDHLFDFGATAVASASSLCQERIFPSSPDFGSAPRAHADREHRWRHIEHLLFECAGILGPGGTLAVRLLRDDLSRACFGSDHASAVPMPGSSRGVLAWCRLRRARGCLRLSLCWQAFALLLGRPSIRGCSPYGLVLCLPRRCSLRLLLFCTCPPLCAGALWPIPTWVWRDVRLIYLYIIIFRTQQRSP